MLSDAPFFIVGAGRSGTTLLRLILAGHSRLCVLPETWYILSLVAELPLRGALSEEQVERALHLMTSHYRWPDIGIPAEEIRDLAAALARPQLVDIIHLVYERYARRCDRPRFGDKTPPYFAIVPQLAELYPDAKFIHLIRDGRDVAVSWMSLDWPRYYEPEFEWSAVMRMREKYRASPLWERFIEVRYEDLVSDLEGSLRTICDFMGETFESEMLDWQNRVSLVPAREQYIHPRLANMLSDKRNGAWRETLSGLECFLVEACLYRQLEQLGYELRFSARPWRGLLSLTGCLMRSCAPLLGRVSRYVRRHNVPFFFRYV